jgi:hypothetical protein
MSVKKAPLGKTMIQNLPPSVVLNTKKNYSKKLGGISAYLSPASSGNSIKFKMGSQESRGNVASNSVNRKNLISKPIVPPHLKNMTTLKQYS